MSTTHFNSKTFITSLLLKITCFLFRCFVTFAIAFSPRKFRLWVKIEVKSKKKKKNSNFRPSVIFVGSTLRLHRFPSIPQNKVCSRVPLKRFPHFSGFVTPLSFQEILKGAKLSDFDLVSVYLFAVARGAFITGSKDYRKDLKIFNFCTRSSRCLKRSPVQRLNSL